VNLLVLNQKLDPADSGLEVAWEWVGELAARVTKLSVITHELAPVPLPANVRVFSLGKEKQFSRLRKVSEFYSALFTIVREERIDACFVHMVPLFALMASPVLKMRRIPMVQWYTHASAPWTLRAALRVVDRIATASRESFSLESPKVVVTGHGINTDRFRPARQPRDRAFHVMTVGRLSPSKRHDRLIEAIARVRERGNSVRVSIVGEPRGPDGVRWMDQLHKQIDDLRLNDVVKFIGPVARPDLPSWYNSADVCVNLSETNSIDKAVLEAMSCGVPVITSNLAFGPVLGDVAPSLALRDSQPATVATALEMVMGMDDRTLGTLSLALRAKVIREHNLRTLMDRLIELLREPYR
jgi:glycosyltransferase involved in cell wall biosynthesis